MVHVMCRRRHIMQEYIRLDMKRVIPDMKLILEGVVEREDEFMNDTEPELFFMSVIVKKHNQTKSQLT